MIHKYFHDLQKFVPGQGNVVSETQDTGKCGVRAMNILSVPAVRYLFIYTNLPVGRYILLKVASLVFLNSPIRVSKLAIPRLGTKILLVPEVFQ